MRNKIIAGFAALALAASSVLAVAPAQARSFGHGGHGGHWRGGGGFVAGALIGGALAGAPYGGYYGPGYGYAYGPDYGYSPDYAYDQAEPGYVTGDATGYCMSRFRSYDPGSGTYLGNDGARHSCP
jgi:BA14K-like protein